MAVPSCGNANSHPGADTVVFDPAGVGTKPKTVRLIGGPMVLTNPATTTCRPRSRAKEF
jgi:hypothetical protein